MIVITLFSIMAIATPQAAAQTECAKSICTKNTRYQETIDKKLDQITKSQSQESSRLSELLDQLDARIKQIESKPDSKSCVTSCTGKFTSMDENWLIFHRRKDGRINFRRNWYDYVNGFGTPCGEYWLGLETILQLTKNGDQKLRIDMIEKGTGTHYYAEYSSFKIESATDNYRLRVSGYSGNATDALTSSGYASDGKQFSTVDADHDIAENGNCAAESGGGWWHAGCSHARLNGRYDGVGWKGIAWINVKTSKIMQLKFVEMKITRKN